ncbi:RagB/SusD family nutrient uptake outer membrane protein [Flavivirga abyssicola]|uniref:RagB/SusD family nutrient uptake outer membrane protein n=1 Tax=Flavivirga abyssicola TaxID=3063533 RepID=UPI0026DF6638|nr:RagB/SusD family nutrient uptake outer membrane protein [Flavivirga sp. MEBiC07777]WVK13795.1 RagB/SusD family nutrient uptake outer membrane protein [Flavivirga sp. MEBiC07777]
MKKIINIKVKPNETIIWRIIPVVCFLLSFYSCDDFLDQTNPNALTSNNFWENNGDLNAGLISVYSVLKDNDVQGIESESVRTDLAVPANFRRGRTGTQMYDLEYTANTDYVNNKWNALYLGVFRANQVIQNYETVSAGYQNEASREEGLRILAQARALRGYFYFVLNNSFNDGSVPLLETIPETFDDFQKAFSTSQKIKDFYRADLQFGLENLPKTYSEWLDVGNNNLGRITAGACDALLGKSYLYENDFTNAELHFKSVIDNYNYELVDDLTKCFTGIDEFNSESIFEVNVTTGVNLLADGEEAVSQGVTHIIGSGGIMPSSRLILLYREEKVDPADPINNVERTIYTAQGEIDGTVPATRLYSLRMGNLMGQVDDPDHLYYGVPGGEFGNVPGVRPYSRGLTATFKKYTHWNTIGGGAGEDESTEFDGRSDINIIVIRLADIYLSYAECMLEKGDLSEALRYINRVRKRSHIMLLGKATDPGAEFNNAETTYVDDINLDLSGSDVVTVSNLMEHLRFKEIPLELSLEGDRAADLRRWGVFGNVLSEMASVPYDYWHYPKNTNGKHGVRFKCFLTRTGELPQTFDPNAQGVKFFSGQIEIQDKVVAANNYNSNFHDYLPIPQSEIDANLNWNDIVDQ